MSLIFVNNATLLLIGCRSTFGHNTFVLVAGQPVCDYSTLVQSAPAMTQADVQVMVSGSESPPDEQS